jgi:hypothetical protein
MSDVIMSASYLRPPGVSDDEWWGGRPPGDNPLEDKGGGMSRDRYDEMQDSLRHQTPSSGQSARIRQLRQAALGFLDEIYRNTGSNREQSLAFTKLEECLMWAVKSTVLH